MILIYQTFYKKKKSKQSLLTILFEEESSNIGFNCCVSIMFDVKQRKSLPTLEKTFPLVPTINIEW